MKNIKNIHDLVALGLRLREQNMPDGFITTVWVSKEAYQKIHAELLDNRVDNENWKVSGEKFIAGGYNFKVLGINFLILC